ncbi:MAG: peptidoglycan DD-metalloendopeptidase family protein [Clostridia bacterium]|nr:peptidoglycan DD-metalloendopeptidase family protein [Clostridia bacterium]
MKIKGKMICSTFIIGSIATLSIHVYADAVSDARNELNSIKNQIKENSQQIESVESEVESKLEEINLLEESISNYTSELETLQSKKDEINKEIETLENNLQNSAQLYNSAEDLYTTRLRAIYENGMPSMVNILVNSEGISDFFSKMNVYTSILEYDQSLINNMKNQKEYVDSIKKSIGDQKLQLEQLEYDVQKSTTALENTKSQKEAKVSELSNSKTKLLAASKILLEQQEAAEDKLQEELNKYYNSGNNYGGTFSGIFQWPTPGCTIITANFGWYSPNGYSSWHSGTDIGCGMGTPVLAAEDGKVVTATVVTSDPNGPYYTNSSGLAIKDHRFVASNGYGYGNNVLIDHGAGSNGIKYSTRYAHLSTVVVSSGQVVRKGQVIGYSGNTGNSYGAHLHFEIRENGTCVNPMSYFY